jgi:hypothetical protein
MANTYDVSTPSGQVRLLLNDVASPWVFTDAEVAAFLILEADSVKRAAAQAIDTNADNEALASKVLRTQDLTTDGAKLADILHQRAALLREQAEDEDGGFFDVVDLSPGCYGPELTDRGAYVDLHSWGL